MQKLATFFLLIVCCSGRIGAQPDDALRQLDLLFTDYFRWFGSMYDRASGGTFYSLPSRESPHLYRPHIESSSKYCRVLEWSQIVPKTPEKQRNAMVSFIKSRQIGDPGHRFHGYFLDRNYSTLNPTNDGASVTERDAGRALGFATGLLELFETNPDYPLPGGGTGAPPSHLASGKAFKTWLDTLDWDRSWTPGNIILSQVSLINSLEPALRNEILAAAWEHLPTLQDPETGLWGNLSSYENSRPYIALNGGHKLAAFYKMFGMPIPHAAALQATALDTAQPRGTDKFALHLQFLAARIQLAGFARDADGTREPRCVYRQAGSESCAISAG